MSLSFSDAETFVDLLALQALVIPDKRAFCLLEDGLEEKQSLTFRAVDRKARAVAAKLQRLGIVGQRVLLLYPTDLEYVTAFLGCLYAGLVAVPAYPPQSGREHRSLPRLRSILADARPEFALTGSAQLEKCRSLAAAANEGKDLSWVVTDTLEERLADEWLRPDITSESLAFLQYSSGSTRIPRGVKVTHRNLLVNEEMICKAFRHSKETIVVGWLPLYHDMGLIGNVLQPLFCGGECILMSPSSFLQQPLRWLQAISTYRASTSGAPNFAYDLCTAKIKDHQIEDLDLGSWNIAYNGSEPVRAQTIEAFSRKFSRAGFQSTSFFPCYGLAEATLFVSGGPAGGEPVVRSLQMAKLQRGRIELGPPDAGEAQRLVGCGHIVGQQQVQIVNPLTAHPCPPDQVGEIWISGPTVAAGYWGDTVSESFEISIAGENNSRFLRTGDLGFILEGQLFVAGRLKDLIIVRGQNHYPQDLEITAERSHPALRKGCSAAFSVDPKDGTDEYVVLVIEVERTSRHGNLEAMANAIRKAVAEQHELHLGAVVLIKPGGMPKTSSGKIQRSKCRDEYLGGRLPVLTGCSSPTSPTSPPTKSPGWSREFIVSGPKTKRESNLVRYLVEHLAADLRVSPEQINPAQPVAELGVDSLALISVVSALEHDFRISVSMTLVLSAPSLSALATGLLVSIDQTGPPAQSIVAPPQSRLLPIASGPGGALPERRLRDAGANMECRDEAVQWSAVSSEQERLWLLAQTDITALPAYNIVACLALTGPVDIDRLCESVASLLRRHQILRTVFGISEGMPKQRVLDGQPFAFDIVESKALNFEKFEEELSGIVRTQARQLFDLGTGPMLRAVFCRRTADESRLLLCVPHIVADGWSIDLLIRELVVAYDADGPTASERPEDHIRYLDYCDRQREFLTSDLLRAQTRFWQKQLERFPIWELPTDVERLGRAGSEAGVEIFQIEPELLNDVKVLAQQEKATPFIVFLAAFNVLLGGYADEKEIVVATSSANRRWREFYGVVGPFTNALLLRGDMQGNPSFREFLHRVREFAFNAYEHHDVPIHWLMREIPQSHGGAPVQVACVLQTHLPGELIGGGVTFHLENRDSGYTPFDLMLTLFPQEESWTAVLKYRRDLFAPETIRNLANHYRELLGRFIRAPSLRCEEISVPLFLQRVRDLDHNRKARLKLVVAATFTGELLAEPLKFWLERMEIHAEIRFAEYSQVFQVLLDPNSLMRNNRGGINILLIRLGDWLTKSPSGDSEELVGEQLRSKVEEFVGYLNDAASATKARFLVVICPSPQEFDSLGDAGLRATQLHLVAHLRSMEKVIVILHEEIQERYNVTELFDSVAELTGNVPFSRSYFIGMATVIARKIAGLNQKPLKVIAVDCDDTLWGGVCAEDGADGIRIGEEHLRLHRFLLEQRQTGVLLCLCSKNQEQDVLDVFARHREFPLSLNDFVAWKINWRSKAKNLQELSSELSLGLEGFVFIDNNSAECAEVQKACPEMLVLQFPATDAEVKRLLDHVWAFDRQRISHEDVERTEYYRHEKQRGQFRRQSSNLMEFIDSLQLQITFRPIEKANFDRVSQLTRRVNQFNTTGRQRSLLEVESFSVAPNHYCFVVEAADRFGDYGLVGAVFCEAMDPDTITVDSWFLSCRALGKGMEHKMLARLGEFARSQERSQVCIQYRPTSRNQPAFDFLSSVASCRSDEKAVFCLSTEQAEAVRYSLLTTECRPEDRLAGELEAGSLAGISRAFLTQVATELTDVASIARAIDQRYAQTRNEASGSGVAPRTPIEQALAKFWQDLLRVPFVGTHDHFLALGGHSLTGTLLVSRIAVQFGVHIPLHRLMENPTLEELSREIEAYLIETMNPEELAAAMADLDNLSETQVATLLSQASETCLMEVLSGDKEKKSEGTSAE